MKKLLSTLIACICALSCAFSFVACGDNSNDDGDDINPPPVAVDVEFDELISDHIDDARNFVADFIRPSVVGEREVKSEFWSIGAAEDTTKIDKVSILYVYVAGINERAVELANVTLTTPVANSAIVEDEVQSLDIKTDIDRETVFEFEAKYVYNNQSRIDLTYSSENRSSDLKLISETEASKHSRVAYYYIVVKNGKINKYYFEAEKGNGSDADIDYNIENGYTYTTNVGSYSMNCSTNIKTVPYTYEDAVLVFPVESVTLDNTYIELGIGGTAKLTATVLPTNATDKSVTYSVEPAGVVSVDNDGNVTAIAEGTAVITVTTTNGKKATCNVTVTKPLTNAEVLEFLNENIALEVAKDWAYNQAIDPSTVTENNYKDITWYITREGENITEANIVFTYMRTANTHHINCYKIDFSSPLTLHNISDGEIGSLTFTQIYSKSINPNIQDEHADLTNAICDKLFGAKENVARYIIDHGTTRTDEFFDNGDASRYTVIEVTDTGIKEQRIHINLIDTDDKLIECLNDTAKYYTYGEEKSHAITGTKLVDNDEKF